MRRFIFAALLAAADAAHAQYTFLLRFPDGSIDVCPATDFVINYDIVSANVQNCMADRIFANGFGG